jgi:predicted DNA-binding transcriptional regulator YafY
MASSKDISKRYKELNEILNEHLQPRAIKSAVLCHKLGITDRQLRTDLKFFREILKAPLGENKQNGHYYTESFAFIERLGMTRDELQQLRIVLEMMTQQQDLASRFGLLSQVLGKIEAQTKKIRTHQKEEKRGKIIFFEPQNDSLGVKLLPFFLDAIEKNWKTAFEYQPFGKSVQLVSFSPYFLKYWEKRWYVGGQSHDSTEQTFIRVYPIDRIFGQPTQDGFEHKKPENFNPETYWANIYGINDPLKDKSVQKIVVRFEGVQKDYFLEAPFFQPFIQKEASQNSVTVEFQLKINIELKRKIASYGGDIKVLEPPHLVEEMRVFFKNALENY